MPRDSEGPRYWSIPYPQQGTQQLELPKRPYKSILRKAIAWPSPRVQQHDVGSGFGGTLAKIASGIVASSGLVTWPKTLAEDRLVPSGMKCPSPGFTFETSDKGVVSVRQHRYGGSRISSITARSSAPPSEVCNV